ISLARCGPRPDRDNIARLLHRRVPVTSPPELNNSANRWILSLSGLGPQRAREIAHEAWLKRQINAFGDSNDANHRWTQSRTARRFIHPSEPQRSDQPR